MSKPDKGADGLKIISRKIKYAAAALSVLCAALLLYVFRDRTAVFLRLLFSADARGRLADWVDSFGPWGIPVLFAVQLVQIVVAVLPGEPVEFAAGMLYGTLGGLAVCLCGAFAGSWMALFLSRRYGRRLVQRLIPGGQLDRYIALGDTKRFRRIALLLFFLPGTPKDVLLYAVGLTEISLRRFFYIAVLARIPSIVSSTMAGAAFAGGEFARFGVIYLVAAALSASGMIAHRLIMRRIERRRAQ
jgi:uncharacterized membrane protein YdjX (TVP38/TMEM64 family)